MKFITQEELGELAPKLICFNLGYLPYTDKSIMTLPKTTVTALQVALEAVDKDGAVSVISYVGHEGEFVIIIYQISEDKAELRQKIVPFGIPTPHRARHI